MQESWVRAQCGLLWDHLGAFGERSGASRLVFLQYRMARAVPLQGESHWARAQRRVNTNRGGQNTERHDRGYPFGTVWVPAEGWET